MDEVVSGIVMIIGSVLEKILMGVLNVAVLHNCYFYSYVRCCID